MLRIIVHNSTYVLQYGTYVLGGYTYLVDCKGIVRQDNFSNTENIYTNNSVDGQSERAKLCNEIEVYGLTRAVGTIE